MSILSQQSVFSAMLQDGPFAIGSAPPLAHPFSAESKQWVRNIRHNQLLKTKYRSVRNQIFDLLGVNTFDEILVLIHDQERRAKAAERAYLLLGNMFGIVGSGQEVVRHLHEYARTADDVISSLRAKVLAPYSAHIETTNEIVTAWDPVELLLALFDDRYHKKARFEAKRKLALMGLAGSIDQRERETRIAEKFLDFLAFLNAYVWSPDLKIGDLEIRYLHSAHNAEDFSCTRVDVLSEEEARAMTPAAGEKLTLVKRRRFRDNDIDIPIYVTIRKKEPAAKVLKLLRKNDKNPATAVDDELGLMAVLNSVNDVKRFVRHLTRSAARAKSFMTLEDISDTLTGGEYQGRATGSSGKTSMLKFFARTGGMRIEFIIHTNRSYLNYIYQRDVAHDEYEVKRIFDTGVVEFLFPPDIYRLDLRTIRDQQLARFRRQIEER
ncbi:hypothetical protein Despr_3051 [Desulfobulbus propionicus DSM 2032]|jgi:hypothetical protein|uniref:Uncharacterized protein n=1 Tax=Desulfobulbus propionicus (strain ATCC 33891 / DSM 2032 / VKM B-1956 / 1pr3) TaxID=577650 RepID=A0A7U3YPJ7_DESPD|nr:hypothetical protein [Desulfobulbus propionicus]ADW19184.1 hypothetical protein Despr_3051 [Desulfobulbus propionicus DSM 2032]